MAYDTHGNFAYGTVVTAPSPATTGTVIVIGTSTFADFPSPTTAYNCTDWPTGTFPLSSNAEIVRVLSKGTDGTLGVSRNAESSGTRSIAVGDQFAMTITKKVLTDVEDVIPVKATAAELNTGTDDAKFATALALSGRDGWQLANETWTYATSDSPTFTVTAPGTLTSKYNAGMRAKLTSGGSVQYYLMSADPTVAAGSSTLTLYGGTAYTLGTGAITSNFYSFQKAPQGFSMNPTFWTVSLTHAVDSNQTNPTSNVWYNQGGAQNQVSIPIGVWFVRGKAPIKADNSGNTGLTTLAAALSTSGTTNSDNELVTEEYMLPPNSNATSKVLYFSGKTLALTTKTTYNLISKVYFAAGSVTTFYIFGNSGAGVYINFISAYL